MGQATCSVQFLQMFGSFNHNNNQCVYNLSRLLAGHMDFAGLTQHAARWAEQEVQWLQGGEEGEGESGFQLPAFTPSLTLKIAPTTEAFWGPGGWTTAQKCYH